MFDHYSINVSQNGKHVFATAPGSCRDRGQAETVHALLVARFPASEGYRVDVTRWVHRGHSVEFTA
jgi:hypothetical protein